VNRRVLRHVAAATLSLALAAAVVAVGASVPLPAFAYPALIVLGLLGTAGGLYAAGLDSSLLFGVWTPWALALILDPSLSLAGGFLVGAVAGVLSVPLVLKIGRSVEAATA